MKQRMTTWTSVTNFFKNNLPPSYDPYSAAFAYEQMHKNSLYVLRAENCSKHNLYIQSLAEGRVQRMVEL